MGTEFVECVAGECVGTELVVECVAGEWWVLSLLLLSV